MDYEENTVVPEDTEPVEDDAQFEGLELEADDPSLSLEDEAEEEQAEPVENQPDAQGTSEPGWIKKRVAKEVQKAVAATEARMKAQYDKQLAPIMERMLEQDARELVRQGEFKSLDRAKEYLQLKQGIVPEEPEDYEQPRNEKGQFESAEDVEIRTKANMLAVQADKILRTRGIDVMAEFNSDEGVRQKIVSGELDFYELADILAQEQAPRRKAPAPMRTPNGAGGASLNAIDSMTDEQFERMERNIREKGARYKLK